MPGYMQVRNLEKYQAYKDGRKIQWLQWHVQILEDYDFHKLSDRSKLLLPYLLILAARTGNKIPKDPKWVKDKIGLGSTPDFEELLSSGFLTLYETVQDRTKPYGEEKRREEKRGEETISPDPKSGSMQVVMFFNYETREFEGITSQDIKFWEEAYPAVDVNACVLAAGVWLHSNPSRRKKNYRKYLTNWFSRVQEKGGNKGKARGGGRQYTDLIPEC